MADYPILPSFGAASGPRSQPNNFQVIPQDGTYEYDDLQPEDRSYEYDKAQPISSFQYNRYIPEFDVSPMTSGAANFTTRHSRGASSYQSPAIAPSRNGRHESLRLSGSPHLRGNQQNPTELSLTMTTAMENVPSSHDTRAQPIEEGELSEGEYEELGTESEPNIVPVELTGKEQYNQADGNRAFAHRALYMKSLEHEEEPTHELVDEYGRSLALNGRSANSYSPYESPGQPSYSARRGSKRARHGPRPTLNQQSESMYDSGYRRSRSFENTRVDNLQSSTSGANTDHHHPILTQRTSLNSKINNSNISNGTPQSLALQSVRDARREAQNAILNLWPFKVRLQNYIDEGIDEEVVRRQFEDLGMLQAPLTDKRTDHNTNITRGASSLGEASVIVVNTMSPISQSNNERSARSMRSISPTHTKNIDLNDNNSKGGQVSIAKPPTKNIQKIPSPVMKEPPTSLSPEASTSKKQAPNLQSIAKADKERLLQQKMEALQKSREQRAQKAAAKNSTTVPTVAVTVAPTVQPSNEAISATSRPPNQPNVESCRQTSTAPYNSSVTKPSMPSIPGLFLAASATAAITSPKDIPGLTQSSNLRKRPVASDFDRPSPSSDPYKRPFGQSRNEQRLVIDVSEDESDGESSNMEVDSKSDDKSTHQSTGGLNNPKPNAIRDLPPLTDFPQRKQFQMPRSTLSTPPAQQTAGKPTIPNSEDLLRKEIQEMKKRIAEAEKKKRARMNLSGSQTPRSNESNGSPAKSSNGATVTDKIEASMQIERLIDNASRKVDEDQQKLAEAHTVEQAKADELKNIEAEQRALRRAKIASDLPTVDAEVEKSQRRLAEIRAEMAQLEAAIQQGLEEKQRLAEEMERLGQESDEAYRDKLQEITGDDSDKGKDTPLISAPTEDTSRARKSATPSPILDNTASAAEPTSKSQSPHPGLIPEIAIEGLPNNLPKSTPDIRTDEINDYLGASIDMPNDPARAHDDLQYETSDHTPENVPQGVSSNAEAESYLGTESGVEMEDSYAPYQCRPAPASTTSSTGKIQRKSGLTGDVDAFSPEDGESDPYEPPEASQPTSEAAPSTESPPFSPAPPELGSESSQTAPHPQKSPVGPTNMALTVLTAGNQHVLPPAEAEIEWIGTDHKTYFTPYESPLKKFRAYRFHPAFEKEVAGGFKSLTYSNNIKDGQELCRYELAGGVCNDPSCEFQHFKTMGLADDAILVELGNSAGYKEEDKPRFVSGLRAVLQDLRQKKTKDFQVIAAEIAAFRARFLQDKSKVILLDG